LKARIGGLNTSTTISGPLVGYYFNDPNAKITKVGTGTLTLSGANSYAGLTKVDGGTLVLNGSTPGSVDVNSGATLKGTGTIGGTVIVNSGGTLSPGLSPGMISIGALAMMPGGILNAELGPSTYDRIVAGGNVALAGILNVSLVDGFSPAAGNSFNLLDWSTVGGAFATINLPALATGLNWNTSQFYSTGVLSVVGGLLGDFNNDGKVDGADYVAWRKIDGSPAGYSLWRTHFGQTAGSGSELPSAESLSAVPEPNLAMLFVICAPLLLRRWTR
jgi:autotransporter-associated beta strand protein